MAGLTAVTGGYDCDFVNPVPEALSSPVRLFPFRDPHLLKCRCGIKICHERSDSTGQSCPVCRERFVHILDKRQAMKLKVHCSKKMNGCDWVGELRCLEDHEKECGFVIVLCQYCRGSVLRCYLTQHLYRDCLQLPIEIRMEFYMKTVEARLACGVEECMKKIQEEYGEQMSRQNCKLNQVEQLVQGLTSEKAVLQEEVKELRSMLVDLQATQALQVSRATSVTPKENKVELRAAEHRWVRFSEMKLSDEEREKVEIFRKFLGILNKITEQNFKALADQAMKLPLTTVPRLNGCVEMLFNQAIKEPQYCSVYADLCHVMSPIKVLSSSNHSVSFRRELLTKCQNEFEKGSKDIKKPKLSEMLGLEQRGQVWDGDEKNRYLGLVSLLGHFLKMKILSEVIIHDCISMLLDHSECSDSVQCVCKLLTITGKDLDHGKTKHLMDRHVHNLENIVSKKKVPPRIIFMVMDVLESRKNEWKPHLLKTGEVD